MNQDLLKEQAKLQQQAQQVLEKFDLLGLLAQYGSPEIVGSMELGLMTRRDVDIEIIVSQQNKNIIAQIASTLINKPYGRVNLAVIDNTDKAVSKLPQGTYLGFEYYGDDLKPEERFGRNEKVWTIDMWFVVLEHAVGAAKTKELKNKLTDERRTAILRLKSILADNPKYRKEITTMDIYNAVLEQGVRNLDGFKKYLKTIGKNL